MCNYDNVLHPFNKTTICVLYDCMRTAGGDYNKVEPENKMEAGHGSCPH